MSPVIVLVIFNSRCGETEKLALAAAVGAVQARANIRLRRLPDLVETVAPEESAECTENFRRMRKEYVPPTERDVAAADAVIFVAPGRFEKSPVEWTAFLDLLGKMGSEGKVEGKIGAAIAGSGGARAALTTTILQCGFIVAPPVNSAAAADDVAAATLQGRKTAGVARAIKPGGQTG